MAQGLELTLFGTPEVRFNQQPVTGFRSSKTQALLYYLAVTGRSHTRAALIGLLWGDQSEVAARASLSKCLSNLHELIGDALLIERQTVGFNQLHQRQSDLECFVTGVSVTLSAENVHSWQAALSYYRGDFLEGFWVRNAAAFEEWLIAQRAHYRDLVVNRLGSLAAFFSQQGDLAQAISSIRQLLVLEPWSEDAHRQLMILLERNGQRAAVLTQFETCRRVLAEELGVEPTAETVAVYERNKTKVINKPAVVHYPVNRKAEPVVSFPIPPTPLIGRERERAELKEMLGNPLSRLITITGPGGIGKTRLAMTVAAEQSLKFRYGALFVPLAGIATAQFLPQAILSALNVPLPGDLTAWQQLRLTLYNQERLVVLDNYEHLLPEVELLTEILYHAPTVKLLVTSRERLALRAEYLYELTGLGYPPAQSKISPAKARTESTEYGAVQLFLQRVRQLQRRFIPDDEDLAAIERICRITEGLPLALELAAVMVREQTCSALATALEQSQTLLAAPLRDLPERHRTMGAVFDHSWRLLLAEERQALRALSVFQGGFWADAAQEVADTTPAILGALVDKSLLRCNAAGRYDMHELIRQQAHEQLVACGAFAEVQQRYTDYFLRLADATKYALKGTQPFTWVKRIEQELDNIRAILKWFTHHTPENALRMNIDLMMFWQSSGYLQESYEWFELTLAHCAAVSPAICANAYCTAGLHAICMNRLDEAEKLFAESFALYQQLDLDKREVREEFIMLLNRQGLVPLMRNEYDQALECFHQALYQAQQIDAKWPLSTALFYMGNAFYLQGLFAEAQRCYSESLTLCEEIGIVRNGIRRIAHLGYVACAQDDLIQADKLFRTVLEVGAQCQDQYGVIAGLVGLAKIAAHHGWDQAATLLLAATHATAMLNPLVRNWPLERKVRQDLWTHLHAHLAEPDFATAWAAGEAMTLDAAVTYALTHHANPLA